MPGIGSVNSSQHRLRVSLSLRVKSSSVLAILSSGEGGGGGGRQRNSFASNLCCNKDSTGGR